MHGIEHQDKYMQGIQEQEYAAGQSLTWNLHLDESTVAKLWAKCYHDDSKSAIRRYYHVDFVLTPILWFDNLDKGNEL